MLPAVCILCGGYGTRTGRTDVPKSLLPVDGKPFIFHQLRLLKEADVSYVVLCIGHQGKQIYDTVGHYPFGMTCLYQQDDPPQGQMAAIRDALPLLRGRFLVLYGDSYLDCDYKSVAEAWNHSGKPALLTTYQGGDYGLNGLTQQVVGGGGDLVKFLTGLGDSLFTYRIAQPWHEIGTPEGLAETEAYIQSKKVVLRKKLLQRWDV